MNAIRCTAWIALLVSLAACATFEEKIVAEGGKRRSGDELREIFSKKVTVNWVSMADPNYKGTTIFTPDGVVTVEARWTGSGGGLDAERDSGKWQIEGDLLCTDYSKGGKSCSVLYKGKDPYSYSLSTDGKRAYKSTRSE